MGAMVGDNVGATDGVDTVGARLGANVGEAVGDTDGDAVGEIDGGSVSGTKRNTLGLRLSTDISLLCSPPNPITTVDPSADIATELC